MKYTITAEIEGGKAFLDLLDNLGATQVVVTTTPSAEDRIQPSTPAAAPAPRTRTPRGSKVNTTIIAALQSGARTVKELKGALEEAGLAPGSLSTGLAVLSKGGQVTRVGDGLYGLAMATE